MTLPALCHQSAAQSHAIGWCQQWEVWFLRVFSPHDQEWSIGEVRSLQTVLPHPLENPWTLDKLRAQQCVYRGGGICSEHNAKRDSGVHPAHLKGWQQSRKQLVVPALALHLLDRFGAVCEWLGGRPWLLSCSHGCCPHWAGELIWILDAAGVFGWLSVPNECLQQFVNRSPSLRVTHTGTFPSLPFLAWFPTSSGRDHLPSVASSRALPVTGTAPSVLHCCLCWPCSSPAPCPWQSPWCADCRCCLGGFLCVVPLFVRSFIKQKTCLSVLGAVFA